MDLGTSILVFSCIWHDTPGEYFECTRKHITTKYAANNSMALSMLNLGESLTVIHLLISGLSHNPSEYLISTSTTSHKTSSSTTTKVVTVDHLERSGRAVQYHGRGYSNRFYTLQRLRTLPTLWSTDLVID